MTFTEQIIAQSAVTRRVVAVLLLLATAALCWGVISSPLSWLLRSQDDWRSKVTQELASARARAGTIAEIRSQVTALPSAPIWTRFYASGGGNAGETLLKDITALCSSAGMPAAAIAMLPSKPNGALVIYTVRVSVAGKADQLKAFAAQVRAHPQYLRIEHLTITSPQTQSQDENPPLTVTMDVLGYARDDVKRGDT